MFRGGYMLFRGVICCSGGLYAVQEGYMDVQGGLVICCSEGLFAVQEGYMMKKIMMVLVATNIVASRPPERRLLMPKVCVCEKYNYGFNFHDEFTFYNLC